jgi:DNA uptake protein ComE-like DNA-binding protein
MIESQKAVEDTFPLYRIGINSADASQLKQIVHIDEVRARSLISLRPFTSLEDLARIPGIGPSRVRDIIQQGLAYVDEEED